MESGATVNTPVSPPRPRWRIPSLLRFDRQEHMYHTKHRRSPTAKSSQNEEMEQNGTKWNKNKEKSLWAGAHSSPSGAPAVTRPATKLYNNERKCNKMQHHATNLRKILAPPRLTSSPTLDCATVVARVPPGPPGSAICSMISTSERRQSRPCYNRTYNH